MNLSQRHVCISLCFIFLCYLFVYIEVLKPNIKKNSIKDYIKLLSNNLINDINFDHKKAMESLNAAQAKDDDLQLLELIRNDFIENPSQQPYNLNQPKVLDPSEGQAAVIDKLLNKKERGFFVDCGANNGERYSNSLFLERHRNWTGILIEANPTVYKELKKKNRKSFTLNACLNTKPYPSQVSFLEDSWWGKIFEGNFSKSYKGIGGKGRFVQIQCFPLYSILLAINQNRVDYFSLDVEGAEKGVIDSIPWEKVDIKTMSIEFNKWPGGKTALIAYMGKLGYKNITKIETGAAADVIFMKDQTV